MTLTLCTLRILPLVPLKGGQNGPCCGSRCPLMFHQRRARAHDPPVLHCQRLSVQPGAFFPPVLCHSACSKGSLICSEGPESLASCLFFSLYYFFSYTSALLKASAVVMELCFLVNNDSFDSSTAFSPAADIDGAEGKETEREGACCCSRLISNMKSTVCVSQALLLSL